MSSNKLIQPPKTLQVNWQNAEQAQKALKLEESQGSWVTNNRAIKFYKQDQWCWSINTVAGCDAGLYKILTALEQFQTTGFKTRKDAINYAEWVVGKDTQYKQDLEKLQYKRTRKYILPNTAYSFIKLGKTSKWFVQYNNTFFPACQCNTRKQSLQFLFDKGYLIALE